MNLDAIHLTNIVLYVNIHTNVQESGISDYIHHLLCLLEQLLVLGLLLKLFYFCAFKCAFNVVI